MHHVDGAGLNRWEFLLLVGLVVLVSITVLLSQVDAWVACRGHDLLLHVQELDHFVKVEVTGAPLVHLLASAVDEPFKCEHLCTVHVKPLTDSHKALFSDGHLQLFVLDHLVDLTRKHAHLHHFLLFDSLEESLVLFFEVLAY